MKKFVMIALLVTSLFGCSTPTSHYNAEHISNVVKACEESGGEISIDYGSWMHKVTCTFNQSQGGR